MSTTIIERLLADGDTPSGEYLRGIGVVDDNGKIRKTTGNFLGGMHVAPGEQAKDAFSRFRISIPRGVLDVKQLYGKDTILMVESLTGSGTSTFNSNTTCVDMAVGTASGDKVIRQTRQYVPYQPGRGMLVNVTGAFGSAPKTNVRQRIGIFDANDGIFFEQTSTGLRVVRRTSTSGSAVDNQVEQASWNIDKLDGTGSSGFALDVSKINLYIIDYAWLGVGEIRIGAISGGNIIYCHKFLVANMLSAPWAKTPCLPIRYEIENTGVAASGTTMQQLCCAAFSEGEFDPLGIVYTADNGITGRSASSGTPLPLVSVRLKSGTGFVRGMLLPKGFDLMTTSNASAFWQLNIGGAITGGAWSALTQGSEINTTGTAISGGTNVDSGYMGAASRVAGSVVESLLSAVADFSGAPDALSLVVNPTTGNATCFGSIQFKEIL